MRNAISFAILCMMATTNTHILLLFVALWASLFAALWLKSDFGANDYIGGALIVGACLATALKREDFKMFFGDGDEERDSGGVNGGSFE